MRNRLITIVLLVSCLYSLSWWINLSTSADNQQPKAERLLTVDALPTKSKRYALVIGVDKYEDQKIATLKGATNDAKSLAKALVDYAGFPQNQVVLLTNDQLPELQPRRRVILEKLSTLTATAKRDGGLLLISFAGHGIERKGNPYLLSSDATLGNENDLELLEDTAVSVIKMKERLKGLDQVILILDACRNDPEGKRGDADNRLTDSFARNFGFDTRNKEVKAFATLYATSPGQVSYEYKEKAQGYFTYALVEALKGQVEDLANEKGEITLGKLVAYLQEQVPKLVSLNLGKQQKPQLVVEGYKPEQLVISMIINIGINTTNIPAVTAPGAAALELEFWNSIKDSNDPEDFKAYLQQYQNGSFVALAKNRLNRLTSNTNSTTASPAIDSLPPVSPPANNSTANAGYSGEPEPLAASAGKFIKIPAGEFLMGAENGASDERPAHRVRISQFEMGQCEVTQAQWQAIMGNNPSVFRGADLPVEAVSWDAVQEFITRLNRKSTKYTYRLPTEAEWEYACRAGTTGDYAGNLDTLGWYANNSGDRIFDALEIFNKDRNNYGRQLEANVCRTHPVGQKQPNAWGLYDMYGNVWEWCLDWYGDYTVNTQLDPSGPNSGLVRVYRGGSWNSVAPYCRSAGIRARRAATDIDGGLGFRLARNLR